MIGSARAPRLPGSTGGTIAQWVGWVAAFAVVTIAMGALRDRLHEAHVVLVYVLLVHVAAARGGRTLGLFLAGAAFLSFVWQFLQPYHTWVVADPLDWLVLPAFLATILVTTQLLHRAQKEAARALQRASEIDRLSALGAETLNVGRADDALQAIAEVIRSTLRLDGCRVYALGDDDREVLLASSPCAHDSLPEDEETGARRIPLRVRDRLVGVLHVRRDSGVALDPAQERFLRALSYYAALGVERVRLVADAERAHGLREADRMKDAVIAAVSHDLRTPLTTIKALAHELASAGEGRAATIEAEADHLNRLVADLLDLSRARSGTIPFALEPNEAEDLVGAALQRVSGVLERRRVSVALDPEGAVLIGRFDFSQTLRALVNLLENAHKYSPAEAPVDLEVHREGEFLTLSVADRGPGIPPAECERIFEPFYRRPGSTPDVGGAGLGLSIARALMEAQGGAVSYAPRMGGGSVFQLRVPGIVPVDIPVEA